MIELEKPTVGGLLKPDPTWAIHDATKLQTYLDCPRKYFYQFVLGWRRDTPNIHLIFGEAIHRALKYMLENGYDKVSEAFDVFSEYYNEHIPPEMHEVFYPKTPGKALSALIEYAARYKDDLNEFDVLETEIPGRAMIDGEGRFVLMRIDAICREKESGKVFVLEHKTTSSFAFDWAKQWTLKIQIGMYTHALYSTFDPSEVNGVFVNGLMVGKTKNDFLRLHLNKSMEMQEDWLWSVQQEIVTIEQNFAALDNCSDSDTTMRSFPKNTESCTKYGGCPFHDFCTAWANPLRRASQPPIGWRSEYWDPERVSTKEEKKYVARS